MEVITLTIAVARTHPPIACPGIPGFATTGRRRACEPQRTATLRQTT
ncbi:hypothetical protein ABZ806_20545 [Spirillospora sp. NPDC047418]